MIFAKAALTPGEHTVLPLAVLTLPGLIIPLPSREAVSFILRYFSRVNTSNRLEHF